MTGQSLGRYQNRWSQHGRQQIYPVGYEPQGNHSAKALTVPEAPCLDLAGYRQQVYRTTDFDDMLAQIWHRANDQVRTTIAETLDPS